MGYKILIVDDDAMNLKMAEFILKQKGYEVEKTESGMEALLYLRDNHVDLILLDIEMPVMSGFKTYEIIKDNREMRDTPVIFLTASASEEDISAAMELGAQNYLTKPFLPPKLIEVVEEVFGK